MARPLIATLTFSLLLFAACRNPDVQEDAIVHPPDTAVVDEPLIDPGQVDPRHDPAVDEVASEREARRVILQDPVVVEAQVMEVDGTVRITAVVTEQGAERAEFKAEQFVAAAMRELELGGRTEGPETLMGPSRLAYEVRLADQEGTEVFAGFKAPDADSFTEPAR